MKKSTILLLGTIIATGSPLGPAIAQSPNGLGYSLPIGVTGPATSSLDRLHTLPRLPPGTGEAAAGPASGDGPPVVAVKPDGVVAVSQ